MLSVSDKSESLNTHTHIDQQKIKFHILGFAGSADKLIRQSANDQPCMAHHHTATVPISSVPSVTTCMVIAKVILVHITELIHLSALLSLY